jgi:ligand-binding sensor domain-containing protein
MKTRQWRQLKELAQMENAMMTTIAENADGRLWIGTINAGLHVFEYRHQTLSRVDAMDVFATHSSHVTCLYLDDNNTMWVGSAKLGIAFTDMNSPSFNLVSTGNYEDVSALMEDGMGNL